MEWQPIETAKKDRTPALLLVKKAMSIDRGRPDLAAWDGQVIVCHHPGLASDGFDIGWSMLAPVGHGGFPDDWFSGWMPLDALPEPPVTP